MPTGIRDAVRGARHAGATLDYKELEARRWLRWTVEKAQGWALSDAQLLARLDVGLAGDECGETLREIERRVVIWDATHLAELCSVLSALERRHRRPCRDAQRMDRLLQRLLCRIGPARALAEACLVSDRRLRRHPCNLKRHRRRRWGHVPSLDPVPAGLVR